MGFGVMADIEVKRKQNTIMPSEGEEQGNVRMFFFFK